MTIDSGQIVDWSAFQAARSELGAGFVRILGYFKEDGVKSVAAIVLPAHTLKGESRQFGAEQLAAIAEAIEVIGRQCVETRDAPDQALEHVVKLRPTFEATLAMLEREANPLVERRPTAFGRRAV